MLCIGAGVIGLEIASSARARGCEVTVLEALPRAMGRAVSPEGAAFIEALHRDAGVALHFEVIVDRLDQAADGGVAVTCRDGRRFAADLVVAGVGMQRNLALAEAAGLALEGGIVVDECGRTSAPDIYAAGDVTAFFHPLFGRRLRLESWRHAQNHGIAVGKAMCGDTTPYDDVPWFWTDQHGVNLQVAGLPADAARTVVRQGGAAGVVRRRASGRGWQRDRRDRRQQPARDPRRPGADQVAQGGGRGEAGGCERAAATADVACGWQAARRRDLRHKARERTEQHARQRRGSRS